MMIRVSHACLLEVALAIFANIESSMLETRKIEPSYPSSLMP